jgi:ubiquinone/menaquinone biosynthesis C-methylase UbiE
VRKTDSRCNTNPGRAKTGVWDNCFIGEVTAEQIINAFYRPTGPHERWGKARIERCMPLITPKPGERILDLACGFGTFTFLCAERGAKTVGLDLSETCLRVGADACSQFRLEGSYHFVLGDVGRLPFPDAKFDKLISIDGFEHFTWSQKRALLSEAHRVLKPGGSFIVYTPNFLTKARKVLRRNLINIALGRLDSLTSTGAYLAEKEPTHIGMVSPFRLRRLFRPDDFKLEFHYDISHGRKRKTAWRILTQEKLPLLRDLLNGRIALVATRTR